MARALLLSLLLGGCAVPDERSGGTAEDGSDLTDTPGDTPGTPGTPGTIPPTPTPAPGPRPEWCAGTGGASGLRPTRARGTAEGGNSTGVHGCTGGYSHYEQGPGKAGSPQLHVIGIYEPTSSGAVDVRVKRSGTSVLVLSAYEATRWNVAVEPGARVERILVTGYHAQSVNAPSGIPVEVRSYDQTGGYLGLAHQWPSHRAADLVDAAEALHGGELTSFRGCYGSNRFDIDEPGEVRPPHEVSTRQEPAIPAGCEALAGESTHCLTLDYGGPSLIGLDSGQQCSSPAPGTGLLAHASSLAWQGDYVYGCIHDRGLARVSLTGGGVDIAPLNCEAVAGQGSGLLVMLSVAGQLAYFDSFEAAARRDTSCVSGLRPFASRMAVHGNQGYFAWHSTNEVETADLVKDKELRRIQLEGYDDWVYGMDATSDGRLLILGPFYKPGLYAFNAVTGAALGTIPLRASTNGLVCRSAGGSP